MNILEKTYQDFHERRMNVETAWYGLRFTNDSDSQETQNLILDFARSIVPTKSSLPHAEQIWQFVVTDEGFLSEVPRDSSLDPADLPNRFRFIDVYEPIRQALSELHLDPAPPKMQQIDSEAWRTAQQVDLEIKAEKKTLKGRVKSLLAKVNFCEDFPSVEIPEYLTEKEQVSQLQAWIEDRILDGTLVNAIRQSSR